ncbi:MAG: hypothetical protein RIT45_1256 [Pseudomonadota bacterium]
MLTLERLQRIRLTRTPPGQVAFANVVLRWDYLLPRRTEIVVEGLDNVPTDRTVFFAMNHTDRYNYWPFQYRMYQLGRPFTATWVKGKYYEHPAMAAFMDACNNIPLPSRGYVIATEFRDRIGRKPSGDEYRALRDRVDRRVGAEVPFDDAPGDVGRFVEAFAGKRDGVAFRDAFDALWARYLEEIVRLTRHALERAGNNLLVFPEGTRSLTLRKGQTGLMQMAWHLGHDIVPVGCNGSNDCYPGNSPFSRGGRIVYRIGAPLRLDGPELAPHAVPPDVLPLTFDAGHRYGAHYEAATAEVMRAIGALLDERYLAPDGAAGGEAGVGRFL